MCLHIPDDMSALCEVTDTHCFLKSRRQTSSEDSTADNNTTETKVFLAIRRTPERRTGPRVTQQVSMLISDSLRYLFCGCPHCNGRQSTISIQRQQSTVME